MQTATRRRRADETNASPANCTRYFGSGPCAGGSACRDTSCASESDDVVWGEWLRMDRRSSCWLASGLCALGLLWTRPAWAPAPACMHAPGDCSLGGVDIRAGGAGADVPANYVVPLYWGCNADWADIPGFSATTFFPELVLEDGTVLGSEWEDYFHGEEIPDSRVSIWTGPGLPPTARSP